jgi:hypothetical protein
VIERNSSRSPSGPASTPEPAEQNPETGGRRGDAEQSGGRDGAGTYLEDLAVTRRERHTWTCTCGAGSRHSKADELGVGQQQRPSHPPGLTDLVVDLHVQRGQGRDASSKRRRSRSCCDARPAATRCARTGPRGCRARRSSPADFSNFPRASAAPPERVPPCPMPGDRSAPARTASAPSRPNRTASKNTLCRDRKRSPGCGQGVYSGGGRAGQLEVEPRPVSSLL